MAGKGMEAAVQGSPSGLYRLSRALELPALLVVPIVLIFCMASDIRATAALTLLSVVLVIVLMLGSLELSRLALKQILPVVVCAAVAAAGRVLFAPFPDVKPVTAICIVAGAVLGRQGGFATGALAALTSNFFFGQGGWTPWQMYAWGLIGYLSAIFAEKGLLDSKPKALAWGFAAAILFGLIMDGMHVVGYVRPFTWPGAAAALLASLPLDCLHGAATVAFLAFIWDPWRRQLKRVLAKYALG